MASTNRPASHPEQSKHVYTSNNFLTSNLFVISFVYLFIFSDFNALFQLAGRQVLLEDEMLEKFTLVRKPSSTGTTAQSSEVHSKKTKILLLGFLLFAVIVSCLYVSKKIVLLHFYCPCEFVGSSCCENVLRADSFVMYVQLHIISSSLQSF